MRQLAKAFASAVLVASVGLSPALADEAQVSAVSPVATPSSPATPTTPSTPLAPKPAWEERDGKWYLMAGDEVLKGWQQVGEHWYYLDPHTGAMQTGWLWLDDAWYYLGTSGARSEGWRWVSGSWYWFDANGKMQTGWLWINGAWYWMNSSGSMRTGWLCDNGTWYYFNPSGSMRTGWLCEGGAWYCFASSGAMLKGWQWLGGAWYYFAPDSGVMATGSQQIDGELQRFAASGIWLGQGSGGNAVAEHGALRVAGSSIVDQFGRPFQLRGVSSHGLAWFGEYVNRESFATWHAWGANCARLALYTEEWGGWCSGGDRAQLLACVERGVEAATAEGMYVIVDWHILSDGNPLTHRDDAIAFFSDFAARHASANNIIYEICNEPNGGASWADIQSYASAVIPVIRAHDADALVVVGTPTWSQDVDQAAQWRVPFDNVAYALHFYAATHGSWLRDRAEGAYQAGLPILVTECGACDASGNGWVSEAEGDAWISWLNARGIGFVAWGLDNKDERASLIANWCTKTGGWEEWELSQEGAWFKRALAS